MISLENGDVQRCLTILSDIFRKYPNFFEQESIHYRIIEMMAAVRRVATENGIRDNTEPGYYIKRILCCGSREEFEQICTEEVRNIAYQISARKKSNIGKIVEMTNKLINERFSQDLNLDDVSKELHISPQYLSRLYKNETARTRRKADISADRACEEAAEAKQVFYKGSMLYVRLQRPQLFQQIVQKACGEVPDRLSETEPVRLLQAGMRTF